MYVCMYICIYVYIHIYRRSILALLDQALLRLIVETACQTGGCVSLARSLVQYLDAHAEADGSASGVSDACSVGSATYVMVCG